MGKKLEEMSIQELWELFPIAMVEHRTVWERFYMEMENQLLTELKDVKIKRISHFGSTSVERIWARNIIDIMVEIDPEEDLQQVAARIVEMGFTNMWREHDRATFNWGYSEMGYEEKVYHLHLRYAGDNEELYFRDYLRSHPIVAREYESIKLDLWRKYSHDRESYVETKTRFVDKYTEIARDTYPNKYS